MKFAQHLVWVGLKPSALVLWSVGRVQSVEWNAQSVAL